MAEAQAAPKAEEKKTAEQAAPATGNRGPRGGGGRGGNRSRGGGHGDGPRGRGGRRRPRGGEREKKEFEEELLQIDRVTRVVKGGRRLRFRATVVIGDRKGRVALGVDKAVEVPQAIQKAVANAKKNLIKVPLVKGTIPHEVKMKFKAGRVMIMPAREGTGVIAGGAMRKIADLAGIEDLLGKCVGSNNTIASGKAMIEALKSFRKPRKKEQTVEETAVKTEKKEEPVQK